jgi:hypothetical protein
MQIPRSMDPRKLQTTLFYCIMHVNSTPDNKSNPKAGYSEEAALARYSFERRNYSGSPMNGCD